jgi:O-antigen/teichoic acid export membrane protein
MTEDSADKIFEMGKTSATGSFHLFIGVAVSTIIMAVGSLILAWLLLPQEYGLYSIALIPSYMIILFRDWGINSAITRYIASLRTENKNEDIRNIIVGGLLFETATGLCLSFLSILLANSIASVLFHRPDSAGLISVVSVAIFSGSLLVASQSSFIGFENMKLNSLTLICQAVVKTTVGPLLIILGFGVLGAVVGYVLGFLVAGVIGVVALYLFFLRNLAKPQTDKKSLSETIKTMLRYGVPLSVSSMLGGFLTQFYGFMMVLFSNDAMIGNYTVASNFSVLLTFFSIPIATVLFPAFSKLNPQNEKPLLKVVFASSVKYTTLLLAPTIMAMMVLSKPMISTLYGEKWIYSPLFLTIYVAGNLAIVFGSLSLGGFLAGIGETKMQMKLGILTLLVGVPLAFLIIPPYGIIGVIVGSTLAGLPSLFWGLQWIWKHYEARADFKSSSKILAASATAALATYASISLLHTSEWIRLVTGATIFLTIYITAAPLIGAITTDDIHNLETMMSNLGIVSKLLNIPLNLAEKIATLSTAKKT